MALKDITDPEIAAIIGTILSEIYGDRDLSFPWYRAEIRSEAEAQAATAELPLVYSWNESFADGVLRGFSVSVNGWRMAQRLERSMARSHPAFATTRDTMTQMLSKTQHAMLTSLCAEFRATPSKLTRSMAA